MSELQRFFDRLTPEYAQAIERCFPRYREMLATMRDFLSLAWPITGTNRSSPRRILDLGCGTGNWSILLEQTYPEAKLTLVDLAPESLEACRQRMNCPEQHEFVTGDMASLDLPTGTFDLVTSNIAIHHLPTQQKPYLYESIARWLTPGGWLIFADQFRGSTEAIYSHQIQLWKELSLSAGSSEAEFSMWMQHQVEHDHHEPLETQLNWLHDAGFTSIDCVWRCLLWSIFMAQKPV